MTGALSYYVSRVIVNGLYGACQWVSLVHEMLMKAVQPPVCDLSATNNRC